MNVVFAGTPDFASRHLQSLVEDDFFTVIAVYTQPDRPAGRGKKIIPSSVKETALANGISVFQPVSLKDPKEQQVLAQLNPDVMVVVAYGLILPPAVLIACQTPLPGRLLCAAAGLDSEEYQAVP